MNILIFDDKRKLDGSPYDQTLVDELSGRGHGVILYRDFKTAQRILNPRETAPLIEQIICQKAISGFVFDMSVHGYKPYGLEVMEHLAEYLRPGYARVVVWSDFADDPLLVPGLTRLGVTRRFRRTTTSYEQIAAEFD